MKRRGFIKTSLATMTACASSNLAFGEMVIPMGENVTPDEMEIFTRDMDLGMENISHSVGNYLKKLFPQTPTETEQNFFRSGFRSLLLVGNFGSLPVKGQVHPWMQKRMMYSAPEVNFTVTTSCDILRNLSDESKEDIRTALMDDPDLGDQILDALELEARSIGVPSARRRQMKVMGSRIIRRLRHSPEMFIDEYLKKTEKMLLAGNSDEAMEHLLKTQVGEAEYLTLKNTAENAALEWNQLDIPDLPVGYKPVITEQDEKSTGENSDLKKRKGLRLLGIGAIVTAVGWLIIAIAGGSALEGVGALGIVLGVTLGPILILIALIILLIKAIKSGKSNT